MAVTASGGGNPERLSQQMRDLLKKSRGRDIEIGWIPRSLPQSSHALMIVFMSFPLCLPVGIPVFSMTLGLTLGFVGFLLAIGAALWIPKCLSRKVIRYEQLSYIIEKLLGASNRMERFFHPRKVALASNGKIMRVHGLFVMTMGLLAAIPLPLPFGNLVAALPLLLLGLSLLEKDGVMVIFSYLAAIPCLVYYGMLAYLGHAGFSYFMRFAAQGASQ